MLDTALAMMQSTVSGYMNGNEPLTPRGNAASSGNRLSRQYRAADADVCVAINEPHQLAGLLKTLGLPPDAAAQGPMASDALVEDVANRIAGWTAVDLDRALNEAGVPCAPVQTLDVALDVAKAADPAFVQQTATAPGLRFLGLPFSIDGDRGALTSGPVSGPPQGFENR
jgi:crotonobetainyl-CoA:carnitine CoA-transferase CaiB-like acyl-CoA transferase